MVWWGETGGEEEGAGGNHGSTAVVCALSAFKRLMPTRFGRDVVVCGAGVARLTRNVAGDAFQVTATNQKMSRLGAVGMAPCSRHGGGILLGTKTQLGGLRQE